MKIEKIDIKKELLDIPDGRTQVEFAVISPLAVMAYRENAEIPTEDVTARTVVYQVKTIWNGNEYHNYLVKKDEMGIFNDLVKLSEADVSALVKKETDVLARRTRQAQEDAIMEIRNARWDVKMAIKKLPWYSRLFNTF